MADLKTLTVAALRKLAAESGIKGVSGLRKAELIDALDAAGLATVQDPAAKGPAKKAPVAKARPVGGKAKADPVELPKVSRSPAPEKPRRAKAATPSVAEVPNGNSIEPASVWEVTASKFRLGGRGPALPEEDLGMLPGSYSEDRLVVVPRDPEWMFIHWELSETSYRRARELVPDGRIVLRIYVQNSSGKQGISEQEVVPGTSRFYARARSGDLAMTAELGLRGKGDLFITMVRSEHVRIPAGRVRPGESRFVTIPFDVPLRALATKGFVAGGSFVSLEGRLLNESEYRRLFGKGHPGSKQK